MAATQQQRSALYTTLADTMSEETADTLMGELPPGGWEQMATKDDLAALEARLTTALTAGLAEMSNKLTAGLAEMSNKLTESQAEMSNKLTESQAEMSNKLTESLAQAAVERAALNVKLTEGLTDAATDRADLNIKLTEGLAAAAEDRAKLFRSQARQLYVTVSTIAAASVSIWIALFTMLG